MWGTLHVTKCLFHPPISEIQSYLPVVTQASDQQGLGTVQVVTKLKCFGSDRIAQEKDVGPKMGSAD